MTALAGATEIDLVVTGEYTVLSIGKITTEVVITVAGKVHSLKPSHQSRNYHYCCCTPLSC
jgi:hypothetical protein